mgnify:FL=1
MAQVKKYWVEEWSQDTRHYEITSNYELDSETLEATYYHVDMDNTEGEDITEEVIEDMEDRGYETIPKDLKVIVKFTGTEYGDDSQTCSGEFAVRTDVVSENLQKLAEEEIEEEQE